MIYSVILSVILLFYEVYTSNKYFLADYDLWIIYILCIVFIFMLLNVILFSYIHVPVIIFIILLFFMHRSWITMYKDCTCNLMVYMYGQIRTCIQSFWLSLIVLRFLSEAWIWFCRYFRWIIKPCFTIF